MICYLLIVRVPVKFDKLLCLFVFDYFVSYFNKFITVLVLKHKLKNKGGGGGWRWFHCDLALYFVCWAHVTPDLNLKSNSPFAFTADIENARPVR
jgi:hypothetical protein